MHKDLCMRTVWYEPLSVTFCMHCMSQKGSFGYYWTSLGIKDFIHLPNIGTFQMFSRMLENKVTFSGLFLEHEMYFEMCDPHFVIRRCWDLFLVNNLEIIVVFCEQQGMEIIIWKETGLLGWIDCSDFYMCTWEIWLAYQFAYLVTYDAGNPII